MKHPQQWKRFRGARINKEIDKFDLQLIEIQIFKARIVFNTKPLWMENTEE